MLPKLSLVLDPLKSVSDEWSPFIPLENHVILEIIKKRKQNSVFRGFFIYVNFSATKSWEVCLAHFWNLKLLRNKPRILLWLQHDVKRSSRFSKLPNCYEGSGKPTSFSIYAAYHLVVNIWEKIIAEAMASLVRKRHAAANNVAEGETGGRKCIRTFPKSTQRDHKIRKYCRWKP